MKVYETDQAVSFLKKHQLLKPYLKAKNYFEMGYKQMIKLKLLQPKKNKQYQFRINNQYRARGYFKEDGFLVTHISDHQ